MTESHQVGKGSMNPIMREEYQSVLNRIDLSPLRNSRVLITGSNGLLGRFLVHIIHFANQLYNLNCKVYGVSRREPNRYMQPLLADRNITLIQADLAEPFEFEDKVDYIFHAACYAQPKLYLQDKLKAISLNVDTVKRLLDIARRQSAKFLFFSSVDVYGDIPSDLGPVPETYNGNVCTTAPRAVYSEAKRLGETICSIFRDDYNVAAFIVRIGHTYGPGIGIDDQRVLGDFVRMALVDKQIRMLDDGSSVKTFGYISDIGFMILKVMLEGKDFVYNVCGVDVASIKQLAEEVAKWSGNVPVIVPQTKSNQAHVGTDVKYISIDLAKFFNEFGKPDFVGFSEGIRRTVEWNKLEFGLGGANALPDAR